MATKKVKKAAPQDALTAILDEGLDSRMAQRQAAAEDAERARQERVREQRQRRVQSTALEMLPRMVPLEGETPQQTVDRAVEMAEALVAATEGPSVITE